MDMDGETDIDMMIRGQRGCWTTIDLRLVHRPAAAGDDTLTFPLARDPDTAHL